MLALVDTDDDTDSDSVSVPHVLTDGDDVALIDCVWLVVSVTVVHADVDGLADVDTDDDTDSDTVPLPHVLAEGDGKVLTV